VDEAGLGVGRIANHLHRSLLAAEPICLFQDDLLPE
jgi:hypothetical protein